MPAPKGDSQRQGAAKDDKPPAAPVAKDPFSQPQEPKPQGPNDGMQQGAAKDNKTQGATDEGQHGAPTSGGISQKAAPGGDSALQDAVADSTDRNTIGQMLIEREQESWARRKAGDAAYFQQNVPDDFHATQANGKKVKQTDLANLARYPMSDYNLSNFDVAFPDSNTAVVTYHADYSVVSRGAAVREKRKVISRWVKRDGDWENVDDVFKKIQSLLQAPAVS